MYLLDCNLPPCVDAFVLMSLLYHNSKSPISNPSGFTLNFIFYFIFCGVQAVIDNQALPGLLHLLAAKHTDKTIIRDICRIISNITARTKVQIQVEMALDLCCNLIPVFESNVTGSFCANALHFHGRL